ncbi:unnamed protein product [Rotaria sp. Silwood1]|nr:unnamed protein product [Rotaria sp. Silwood1]
MMIIGLLGAIASGASYPLILLIYQSVVDSFVAIGRNQTGFEPTGNVGLGCRNKTSSSNDANLSPYDNIISTIKWYAILGICCFVLLYIAFNCWIITAERQVRKMRYALMTNIMRQDIGWFDRRLPSDLSVGLLVDALDNIRDGIGYQVADCTALLARIFGCLAYSISVGWKLSLVFLSISPLIIITFNVTVGISPIDYTNSMGFQPPVVRGDIEFRNVTFNYPSRKEKQPILNNLSLRFAAGKTTAIVGETGCGKSTVIQLIQRFYDSEQGQILLDNVDIRHVNLHWLRSKISVVSQEPVLFTDTVAENIRFGNMSATSEEIRAAARIANIHNFIEDLPEGYNTLVQGSRLAGGQKQRIAIARAVLSNPKILLLDEATSALDAKNEREVQIALEQASKGRTTIVVAHRLTTIRHADIIIGLKAGQIEEQGTHAELMKRGGQYAQSFKLQRIMDPHDEDAEDENNDKHEPGMLHNRI